MNILIVGDVVGKAGVLAVKRELPKLIENKKVDFTIVNGENSADGMGITKNIFDVLVNCGANIITMGNHTWGKKDIFSFIDEPILLRPANYAEGVQGHGTFIFRCKNKSIGVIDLIGRVNTGGNFDSPFTVADNEIKKLKEAGADIVVVEIHAEATAEKVALAYYLKDKVNIIYGTHTHIQTADAKIYNTGMGYITDVGMTGPKESIIGMEPSTALKRFLTQIPERYSCAEGEYMMNAVLFEMDEITNKITNIETIQL